MALTVTLSSVGNPDFDQDPSRSLPGVTGQRKRVDDLAHASRVCREYIEENGLGGGNWSGGDVFDENGALVGKVSYNGRVWGPAGYTLNGKPLYDPAAGEPKPVDPFAFEEAVIDIPGYGKITVGGCYRIGTIKSVPGQFELNGTLVEFIESVTHAKDGAIDVFRAPTLHPDGNMSVNIKAPKAMMSALKKALEEWAAQPEGMLLVARNERKDQCQEKDYLTRNIARHSEEMQKLQSKRTEVDVTIEDLDYLIEQIEAAKAPGRAP